MLKMSFYDGTLDRKVAAEVVEKTNKELYHRYGFAYKGAEARPISKENALGIIKDNSSWLDIDEFDDYIELNTFNENDMW